MHPKIATGRVGIYARYSSDKQRESSIEDQLRNAREVIARVGGDPTKATVFADFAKSATSVVGREGLDNLLRAIERGQIDIVLTEDVSRLSRDMADSATIFKRLEYARVPMIGLLDGVDTSAKGGKLTFAFKSMMAEWYIDELRERTRRGLSGRHLAGFATGGVPYGYRTKPEQDGAGRVVGHRISIDEMAAAIIRRIFIEYRDDGAFHRIARQLNREGIPSPRAGSKHKRFGWGTSTIRAILKNEKYTGVWRFNEREWVRVPGTNKRRPRARAADEVITMERPELRIIDAELWTAVQARLAAVSKKYKGDGPARAPGAWKTTYLLSGIAVCDECGFPLTIYGSNSGRYYRCNTHYGKGTCKNDVRVREPEFRANCLSTVRQKLQSKEGIEYVRRQVAERLRDWTRTLERDLTERRERLQRTEDRIKGLVQFIADGDRSEYVVATLRDLEAQAKGDRAAIERIQREAREPLRLPSLGEITRGVFEIDRLLAGDVPEAQRRLRAWLKDGEMRITRKPNGYQVHGEVFPLALAAETTFPSRIGSLAAGESNVSSGGRI